MNAINHMGFIVASYAAAVAIVGVLIAWVTLDYRTQLLRLSDLEMRGVTRRSAPARSGSAIEQTKEKA
jgi:heme exporter protein D